MRDCGYFMKGSDMFGESIGFNIDGQEKYKTCCGSCFSIGIMVFCLMYLLTAVFGVINDTGSVL
jgi:hypothetical protein